MDATQESISWETYLTAGTKALDLGRYEDSEKLFQKALIEARKELGQDSDAELKVTAEKGVARISEAMGQLYRLQGLFKEAEGFYKQALGLNEKISSLSIYMPFGQANIEKCAKL